MKPGVFLGSSLGLLACGLGIWAAILLDYERIVECTTVAGFLGCCCMFLGLVLLDIYRSRPSKRHTVASLLEQYLIMKVIAVTGRYISWKFFKACKNTKKHQEAALLRILNQNKGTVFSKDFGLNDIREIEDFRQTMSLTRYSHYEKYVDMITEEGTQNVLFPFNVDYVALTSGTTKGKSKGYPKSYKCRTSNMMPWLLFAVYLMRRARSGTDLKRLFQIQPQIETKVTASRIGLGPIGPYMFGPRVASYSIVPGFFAKQEAVLMYVYALFGLLEEDLVYISSMTCSSILTLFNVIEQNWETLCDDIERGRLPDGLDIEDADRSKLNRRLQKDPTRAKNLRAEFSKGFIDIVRRIWPECRLMFGIRTGSYQIQAKLLRERYIGDIPIITLLHTGTESMYGINTDIFDDDVVYTPILDNCFFEFVPEKEMESESPTTLLAHQVEVGQTYEMIITTIDGLYRYRTEDIVQITGYRDTAPLYQFVRRAGDILSANIEKVPEVVLHEAVTMAAKGWSNGAITEFTSVENLRLESVTGDVTGTCFYIVFLEMADDALLTEAEKAKVDKELRSRHEFYDAMRASGKLRSVRVVQVKPGTFDRVKTLMLELNEDAHFMQYKLPRIVRREDVLKLLLQQACPARTP